MPYSRAFSLLVITAAIVLTTLATLKANTEAKPAGNPPATVLTTEPAHPDTRG